MASAESMNWDEWSQSPAGMATFRMLVEMEQEVSWSSECQKVEVSRALLGDRISGRFC